MIKTNKKRPGFLKKTGSGLAGWALDSSVAKNFIKEYSPEMYAEYKKYPEKYKETKKKNMKAFRAGNLTPEILKKEAIAKISTVAETKEKKTKKKKNKNSGNVVSPEQSNGKSKSNKPAPIKQGVQQGVQQETVYGMAPYMLPKEKEEEEEKITDDIKPLGSPGMYGAIVLGLFSFAAYLQFSAFRDKQL
jgi:hypothetical protein